MRDVTQNSDEAIVSLINELLGSGFPRGTLLGVKQEVGGDLGDLLI